MFRTDLPMRYSFRMYWKITAQAHIRNCMNWRSLWEYQVLAKVIESERKSLSLPLKMNIPKKIKGIKAKDIPRLAKYADKEGNPLYPVPKLMDDKELRKFYYKVME